MSKPIKFIVDAVIWFDRVNGNTYHSTRIIRCKDGDVLHVPFQYGYGDHYRQTSKEAMLKARWIPKRYKDKLYSYEMENNYPIHYTIRYDTKRMCKDHGKLD